LPTKLAEAIRQGLRIFYGSLTESRWRLEETCLAHEQREYHLEAQSIAFGRGSRKRGNMPTELKLSVNGTKQTVNVDPDTPLLFVLRNELKLTGPRMGCGMAQCGACAVLLNGKEIRSCITAVSGVVGQDITTIEGLPAVWAAEKGLSADQAEKTLHPVQQAWIDEQVPQCGYCQSGMMMVAVQLLEKNPNPSVEQIKDAFTNTPPSPHLCRCGTYAAIIDAVQRAGKAMRGVAL
jgi:isoquinoline 1-oxidoreductase alpha subunit